MSDEEKIVPEAENPAPEPPAAPERPAKPEKKPEKTPGKKTEKRPARPVRPARAEKKPEPKQETADEVSAEEETPTQEEQKDGASA